MGKVLPNGWPLMLSGTMPELAGGGDRGGGAAHAGLRACSRSRTIPGC